MFNDDALYRQVLHAPADVSVYLVVVVCSRPGNVRGQSEPSVEEEVSRGETARIEN